MSEDKQEEPQDQEDQVDLSRFSMNVVEGEDTDRPAEKPKRTIGLLAVVVVAVVIVAGFVAWSRVGTGTSPLDDPRQRERAQKFLDNLKQRPSLQGYLKEAAFIDQDRLRIVIVAALPQPTGQPRAVTQEEVERVVRTVAELFAKHRRRGILAVHAFKGDEQVATALCDADTKQISIGPPMPITDRTHIGGAFEESGAGEP